MAHHAPSIQSRSQRTRTGLVQAFITLMFREGFDGMSVGDVVLEAGMARSTFYEHFSSKEDILQASMAHLLTVMADCVSEDLQPPQLDKVLAHFWQNRRLADAIFSGHSRLIIARSLADMIERRLRDAGTATKPALPYRLTAVHVSEAQLALVASWLRGHAFCTPDGIAAALYRSSRASTLALLSGP